MPARGQVFVGFVLRAIAPDLPVTSGHTWQPSSKATLQNATVDARFDALRGIHETILQKVRCACDRHKRGVQETSCRGRGRARVQKFHACGCHDEACSDTLTTRCPCADWTSVLDFAFSIATPTPGFDDVSSARAHHVEAAAVRGEMRGPFECPPVFFMESEFELIGTAHRVSKAIELASFDHGQYVHKF